MEGLKVIELDDEFVIIREYAWQRPETITVSIMETDESGNVRLVKEWKEQRKPEKRELFEDVYIFTKIHLERMEYNFQAFQLPYYSERFTPLLAGLWEW